AGRREQSSLRFAVVFVEPGFAMLPITQRTVGYPPPGAFVLARDARPRGPRCPRRGRDSRHHRLRRSDGHGAAAGAAARAYSRGSGYVAARGNRGNAAAVANPPPGAMAAD